MGFVESEAIVIASSKRGCLDSERSREPSVARWTNAEIRLNFEISDIRIFARVFRGVKSSAHFLKMKNDELLQESHEILSMQEIQAVELGSCSVDIGIKKIQFQERAVEYCMSTYQHYYVNTESDFNQYLQKFRSKTRSTLKRKVHRVLDKEESKGGDGNFIKFTSVSEMQTFIEHASIVSAKTYQERLFNRGIPTDGEFLLRVQDLARQGLVRGYILYVADKPIAYTYVPFVSEGIVLYDYNGYDPDFAKLSPGTVMQYKIIEDLCADPNVTIYDLCVGDDEHKALFATDSRYCADMIVLRNSLQNLVLILTHLALVSASTWIGMILKSVNLKCWVKRIIRRNSNMSGTAETIM